MQRKVKDYIETWKMLSEGDTVIVGLSGGADSVCLFYLLKDLEKIKKISLIAVHINHGIRGEASDKDERYVRKLCGDSHTPLECFHVNVPELAKEGRLSEEEAGRMARRNAFEKVLRECGGTKIALAHHKDDNAETFLLNAARGSRIKGLGGMAPVNGVYIRPLLCVERKEVEDFLEKKGIEYCIDESNREDTYTRNRIRQHLIPYLTDYVNPCTVEHISAAMGQLREIQGFMESQMQKAYSRCVRAREEELFIQVEMLKAEEKVLRDMVLRKALTSLSGREKDIEHMHVHALTGLLEKQCGRRVDLPYGMQAVREYDDIRLFMKDDKVEDKRPECLLPVKSKEQGLIRYGDAEISWQVFPVSQQEKEVSKKPFTKWFDYDIIDGDISVRTRQTGDRIVIDDCGSTQKLKSYFINEKIPAAERDGIPLIAKGGDILWITGYRQSKAYQVTIRTKTILEISINGGTRNNGGDN